jgi:hypothetical protein
MQQGAGYDLDEEERRVNEELALLEHTQLHRNPQHFLSPAGPQPLPPPHHEPPPAFAAAHEEPAQHTQPPPPDSAFAAELKAALAANRQYQERLRERIAGADRLLLQCAERRRFVQLFGERSGDLPRHARNVARNSVLSAPYFAAAVPKAGAAAAAASDASAGVDAGTSSSDGSAHDSSASSAGSGGGSGSVKAESMDWEFYIGDSALLLGDDPGEQSSVATSDTAALRSIGYLHQQGLGSLGRLSRPQPNEVSWLSSGRVSYVVYVSAGMMLRLALLSPEAKWQSW